MFHHPFTMVLFVLNITDFTLMFTIGTHKWAVYLLQTVVGHITLAYSQLKTETITNTSYSNQRCVITTTPITCSPSLFTILLKSVHWNQKQQFIHQNTLIHITFIQSSKQYDEPLLQWNKKKMSNKYTTQIIYLLHCSTTTTYSLNKTTTN